jgi:hypothetical protein
MGDSRLEPLVLSEAARLGRGPGTVTKWRARFLARQVGISPTSVHRIWRAFGLQP